MKLVHFSTNTSFLIEIFKNKKTTQEKKMLKFCMCGIRSIFESNALNFLYLIIHNAFECYCPHSYLTS